jgi:hypothetical protein
MRYTASARAKSQGFTILESLLMIGLMTVLALVSWAIYIKETDPERKGPGVWEQADTPFVPAFHDADTPVNEPPEVDPLTPAPRQAAQPE